MAGFIGAPRKVLHSALTSTQKLVMLVLIDHLPVCRPSAARIAALGSLCERTVRQTIAELEQAGAITVERRAGCPSVYQVDADRLSAGVPVLDTPAVVAPAAVAGVPADPGSRCRTPRQLVQGNPGNWCTLSNQISKQRSTPPTPRGGKTSKAKTQTGGDPRIGEVIGHYHDTFSSTFERKPVADYPRAAKAIQRALTAIDADTLKRAITIQLTARRLDQYARGRDALKLTDILRIVDEILAWSPSPAKPRLAAVPAEPPTQTYNLRKLPGR